MTRPVAGGRRRETHSPGRAERRRSPRPDGGAAPGCSCTPWQSSRQAGAGEREVKSVHVVPPDRVPRLRAPTMAAHRWRGRHNRSAENRRTDIVGGCGGGAALIVTSGRRQCADDAGGRLGAPSFPPSGVGPAVWTAQVSFRDGRNAVGPWRFRMARRRAGVRGRRPGLPHTGAAAPLATAFRRKAAPR